MKWIYPVWQRLLRFFNRCGCYRKIVRVEELPDCLHWGTLYLIGEKRDLWFVALLCPCGCQEIVQLPLLPDRRPRWEVLEHLDGSITLSPSVWRQVGCRSHFYLRQGRVEWCRDRHVQ